MKQAVIIACAGWKGAGREAGFPHVPAPFLPLPGDTTAVERLAEQFKRLGYDIVLTVGPQGYPFRSYQPRHKFRMRGLTSEESAREIGVNPDNSPWSASLYDFASELGQLIVQPDPGWKTKHDSYCVALDAVSSAYDRFVLVRGDKLYETWFLERVLETTPFPAQFSLEVFHSIVLLDRRGLGVYRDYAERHRSRSTTEYNWDLEMAKQPDGGEGTGVLSRSGIAHYGWHVLPWDKVDGRSLWEDVDQTWGYELARQHILEGRYK